MFYMGEHECECVRAFVLSNVMAFVSARTALVCKTEKMSSNDNNQQNYTGNIASMCGSENMIVIVTMAYARR